jgi:hypothetical protein
VLYRRLVAQQGSEGILDLAATLHGPVFGPLAALTPHTAWPLQRPSELLQCHAKGS